MTETVDPDTVEAAETFLASLVADSSEEPSFDAPWQARVFAIAVALADEESYDWDAFQDRFIEEIQSVDESNMDEDVEGVYYERWFAVLEDLLADSDLVDPAELAKRQAEFQEGDRDEAEFVLESLENENS